MSKENLKLGSFYILLSAFSFALMSALVKSLDEKIHDFEIVFFRNIIGLALIVPLLFFPERKPLATKFFPNHFVRALASVLTLYCLYYSIHHILLADAMLLNNTMPLFVPFVMFFWKGEKIPRKIFFPLALSFFGIILILDPDKNFFHLASIMALLSGVLMAIATVGVRLLGKQEPFYRIMFYTLGIGSIISAIPLFFCWESPANLTEWLTVFGIGIFGLCYQFSIIKGYSYAHPTKVSSLIYFSVIISGLFDWIFWDQVPKFLFYIGLVFVVVGAYFCTRIEEPVIEKRKLK